MTVILTTPPSIRRLVRPADGDTVRTHLRRDRCIEEVLCPQS